MNMARHKLAQFFMNNFASERNQILTIMLSEKTSGADGEIHLARIELATFSVWG